MNLDPGILTLVQSNVLTQIANGYQAILGYAQNLLYIFIGIEIVLFGFFWALQGNIAAARLFLGLLKIGLLIFIISNFGEWLAVILKSIAQISGNVINLEDTLNVLLSPGNIWAFGYDNCIKVIKLASTISNPGLSITLSLIGFSIILLFGLMAIQLIFQVAAFYLGALCALLFMPIGVFRPSSDFAFRAIRVVLQLAVRLLVVMIILGLAIPVWHSIGNLPDQFNFNQLFGLFFSVLVFWVLMIKLPGIVAQVIGEIKPSEDSSSRAEPNAVPSATAGVGALQDIRSAVAIDTARGGLAAASFVAPSANIQVNAPASGAGAGKAGEGRPRNMRQASQVSPSISPDTLRKLKQVARGSGDN